MDVHSRPGRREDLDGLWELFRLGFGASAADRDHWTSDLDVSRATIIEGDGGEVAAATHVRPFRQHFGGRAVPLAGYSPVAVLPEYRGRGWGRAVTAAPLADLRERGEVIAGLFPASVALYRSVGFEVAGSYVHRRIPAAHLAALDPAPEVVVRRGTAADLAAVHRCYARLSPRTDGSLVRPPSWWARRLAPDLAGTELYVVDDPDTDGEVAGYAAYRHGRGRHPYDYSVVVTEVHGATAAVQRALWRVVGSSGSQAPDVAVVGPAEDPLFLLTGSADPLAVRSEIRWMIRLVDAAGAVAARGWNAAVAGRVDLEVVDDHAPWNAGRWVLEVADGVGRLTRGGSGAVTVTVGGLSAWWAGYAPARLLAATGHVASADRRALDLLDGLGAATPPTLVDFY